MIYPNYFKWPGKVWICSDLHLGDKGILRYERTEFETPEEHNDFVIKSINRQLNKEDTFVCLGDLGQYWEDSISKIKSCEKKILIMGNHDKESKGKYRKYFDEVYDGPLFVNKYTVLSHEPIPVSDHFLNIHGHLHNSLLDDDHHLNVSIAMAQYKLFPLDDSFEMTAKYPRIKAKFLEEWYADKYVFTDTRKDCLFYPDTMHVIPRKNVEEAIKLIDVLLEGDENHDEIVNFYKTHRLFKEIRLQTKSTDSDAVLALELIKIWKATNGQDS